ncbi:mucin-2-like [Hoplias malabaricus]|uniref:mucin-2-like n=1 Tax=Hoplias malabaricus TaxID=27720 RepID=UPI00346195D5
MEWRTLSCCVLVLALTWGLQVNAMRVRRSNHVDNICSMWGNFHFRTFDGDVYQFQGICEYNLVSECNGPVQSFSVHVKRAHVTGNSQITRVLVTIGDTAIEVTRNLVMINSDIVKLPHYVAGVLVEKNAIYTKLYAKLGLSVTWNRDDAIMVELDTKYANHTCGLCGDFNGIPLYDEFLSDARVIGPIEFGNKHRVHSPNDECEDLYEEVEVDQTTVEKCQTFRAGCAELLEDNAWDSCTRRLNPEPYIQACIVDRCWTRSGDTENTVPLCTTLSEYSRQCSHAGGTPPNWRKPNFCVVKCPFNMEFSESGSPCLDTCTHTDTSSMCEEHKTDGCFCPSGTVFDDISERGCIPQEQCQCQHKQVYNPGDLLRMDDKQCVCQHGKWACENLPTPGLCAVEEGSHFTTFDGREFTFHGDCYYVLSKDCVGSRFIVLGQLIPCIDQEKDTCLKSIALLLNNDRNNVLIIKDDGMVRYNGELTLPYSTAELTVFKPSSFHIMLQTSFGLQMQVQLVPIMQLYISLDQSFQTKTCGLCGNFNKVLGDEMKTPQGLVEGTAASFGNSWKVQYTCPDRTERLDDPCSYNIDSERYAEHWCSKLMEKEGPFVKCHSAVNPESYYKRCKYASCTCEKSESCLCAVFSSYVRACTVKGIFLQGWRDTVCEKYTENCPASQTYSYLLQGCQRTCDSLSSERQGCSTDYVPVDGCACPDGLYENEKGICVAMDKCSCYHNGEYVKPGKSINIKNEHCVCTNGKLQCQSWKPFTIDCPTPKVFFNCSEAGPDEHGLECAQTCVHKTIDCFVEGCASGCQCPSGLLDDGRGHCVKEHDCPCKHNGHFYAAGSEIPADCNTCICKQGHWDCTDKKCPGICTIYGSGHYNTFDKRAYGFSGDCGYIAVQNKCGNKTGTFSVITENVPCGTTGTTCSKSVRILLGQTQLDLLDGSITYTDLLTGPVIKYKVSYVGLYLIIESDIGLTVFWDRKTTVRVILQPQHMGDVCGLCGNYNGNGDDDFTTQGQLQVTDILEFVNSWKVYSLCPDSQLDFDPCSKTPTRHTWAKLQCSIITSETFKDCHQKVDPSPYFDNCVRDSCACDTGGDCECFCTAVAAYAQACNEAGVCVAWRTPEICPVFCEYYNGPSDCLWHYNPCHKPCYKTCLNPEGVCTDPLPNLEGCYPVCPEDKPIFNERNQTCVEICDECRVEDNLYPPGQEITTEKPCTRCFCDENGSRNVTCTPKPGCCFFNGTEYGDDDVIYDVSDNMGMCYKAICINSTVIENKVPCTTTAPPPPNTTTTTPPTPSTTTTTPPTPSTTTTPPTPSTTSTTPPTPSTTTTIPPTPSTTTSTPPTPSTTTTTSPTPSTTTTTPPTPSTTTTTTPTPSTTTTTTPPTPSTTTTTPPTPSTTTTTPPIPSTTTTTPPTPSTTTSPPTPSTTTTTPPTPSTTTTTTPPKLCDCEWTEWFNVYDPRTGEYNDTETYENIKSAGKTICEVPEDIICRAADNPEMPFDEFIQTTGQVVECNVSFGLVCEKKNQVRPYKCFDYEISVFCCDVPCDTTTLTPSTATTTPPTPSTTTTTPPTPSTTTTPTPSTTTTTPPTPSTTTTTPPTPSTTTSPPTPSTTTTTPPTPSTSTTTPPTPSTTTTTPPTPSTTTTIPPTPSTTTSPPTPSTTTTTPPTPSTTTTPPTPSTTTTPPTPSTTTTTPPTPSTTTTTPPTPSTTTTTPPTPSTTTTTPPTPSTTTMTPSTPSTTTTTTPTPSTTTTTPPTPSTTTTTPPTPSNTTITPSTPSTTTMTPSTPSTTTTTPSTPSTTTTTTPTPSTTTTTPPTPSTTTTPPTPSTTTTTPPTPSTTTTTPPTPSTTTTTPPTPSTTTTTLPTPSTTTTTTPTPSTTTTTPPTPSTTTTTPPTPSTTTTTPHTPSSTTTTPPTPSTTTTTPPTPSTTTTTTPTPSTTTTTPPTPSTTTTTPPTPSTTTTTPPTPSSTTTTPPSPSTATTTPPTPSTTTMTPSTPSTTTMTPPSPSTTTTPPTPSTTTMTPSTPSTTTMTPPTPSTTTTPPTPSTTTTTPPTPSTTTTTPPTPSTTTTTPPTPSTTTTTPPTPSTTTTNPPTPSTTTTTPPTPSTTTTTTPTPSTTTTTPPTPSTTTTTPPTPSTTTTTPPTPSSTTTTTSTPSTTTTTPPSPSTATTTPPTPSTTTMTPSTPSTTTMTPPTPSTTTTPSTPSTTTTTTPTPSTTTIPPTPSTTTTTPPTPSTTTTTPPTSSTTTMTPPTPSTTTTTPPTPSTTTTTPPTPSTTTTTPPPTPSTTTTTPPTPSTTTTTPPTPSTTMTPPPPTPSTTTTTPPTPSTTTMTPPTPSTTTTTPPTPSTTTTTLPTPSTTTTTPPTPSTTTTTPPTPSTTTTTPPTPSTTTTTPPTPSTTTTIPPTPSTTTTTPPTPSTTTTTPPTPSTTTTTPPTPSTTTTPPTPSTSTTTPPTPSSTTTTPPTPSTTTTTPPTPSTTTTTPSTPSTTTTTPSTPSTTTTTPSTPSTTTKTPSTPSTTTTTPPTPSTTTTTSPTPSTTTTTPPTPSTTECFCIINGNKYEPGQIIYDMLDIGSGICLTMICSNICEISNTTSLCPTTTTSTSPSPTPPYDCPEWDVNQNETFELCNCTMARCIEDNIIEVIPYKCPPVQNISCLNGKMPVLVPDENYCCEHYACDCFCEGWGDPHYITFDGLFYSHQGNCTYVLMEEIRPKHHLKIYIDNVNCDPREYVSCPRALIVAYNNVVITLKNNNLIGAVKLEALIGHEVLKRLPFAKNGVRVLGSGVNMILEIPQLEVVVTFGVTGFSVFLPFRHFGNNTHGHCGTCNNNKDDDCRLPDGKLVDDCEIMADYWPAKDLYNPDCPVPATVPPTLAPTKKPCPLNPVCELLNSDVFKECHPFISPDNYFKGCQFDSCHMTNPVVVCTSLQTYASACSQLGICIHWRNYSSLCIVECQGDKVYKPCGPAEPPSCEDRPDEQTLNVTTEGCFCPDGQLLFNKESGLCVDKCGCLDPSGQPRELGEEFQYGCQDCICDASTVSVICKPKQCSNNNQVTCTEPGFIVVNETDPTDECCTILTCRCDSNFCPSIDGTCNIGYAPVLKVPDGKCCPELSCEPKKVCVHRNMEYEPGTSVPVVDCQDCQCTWDIDPKTQLHQIQCLIVTCDEDCESGYDYVEPVGDECCGKCVQTKCLLNLNGTKHVLQSGEEWSPKDEGCDRFTCAYINGEYITTNYKIHCPPFSIDNCQPGTMQIAADGCCQVCVEKEKGCKIETISDYIIHNECQSENIVDLTHCEGDCTSYSKYSELSSSSCSCCQAARTSNRTVNLKCLNGDTVPHIYIHVEECSCSQTKCHASN